MCHKILLVGLVLFTLLSGLVSSSTKANKDKCTAYDYTPYKGCGLVPASSRIVGGDDVSPHSIPWQVGLLIQNVLIIACGGTLLTEQHVLTAAHCTFDMDNPIEASDIRVVVAEHNQTDGSDGIKRDIRSYTNHPYYNVSAFTDYDFSMLHLTVPVNFGDRAVPACLPDLRFSEDELVGKYLTVSGWGALGNPEYDAYDYLHYPDLPDVLQSVDVPVVSQHDCRKAYLKSPSMKITNAMICAGYRKGEIHAGEIDACHGDSGGPLTYKENGRSYLIGVVSFNGNGICASPDFPVVYARVTTVLNWIDKELRSSC